MSCLIVGSSVATQMLQPRMRDEFNSNDRASKPIRVLVVDDHERWVHAIQRILEGESDIEVVGSSNSVDSAIEQIGLLLPDVVLTDIRLLDASDDWDRSGIGLLERVRSLYPEVKVIIYTGYGSVQMLRAAFHAGACDFLSKDDGLSRLQESIREAAAKGKV